MRCLPGLLISITIGSFAVESKAAMTPTAVDHALQAASIQTGVADIITKTQRWGEREVLQLVETLGIAPIVTPVAFVHRTLNTKSIMIPVQRNKLYLHTDSVKLEIPL
jgi:hypothetical protein